MANSNIIGEIEQLRSIKELLLSEVHRCIIGQDKVLEDILIADRKSVV